MNVNAVEGAGGLIAAAQVSGRRLCSAGPHPLAGNDDCCWLEGSMPVAAQGLMVTACHASGSGTSDEYVT